MPTNAMTAAPHASTDVVDHIVAGTQIIVPLANEEPTALLDAIEHAAVEAPEIEGVRTNATSSTRSARSRRCVSARSAGDREPE